MALTAAECLRTLEERKIEQLRLAWCDVHGRWHAKTLLPRAWPEALAEGVRAASSLALKDSSGRTAVPVFDAGRMASEHPRLADFAMVGDMLWRPDLSAPPLVPDPEHAPHVAFLPCTAHDARTGVPLGIDPQQILAHMLERLGEAGYGLRVGIEIEFHVWSVAAPADPADQATWPGGAPAPNALGLLHPGYQLLSDRNAWVCQRLYDRICVITAALGLPLASLEIEMGPSQFELVLEAQDAAQAARSLALLRGFLPALLAREGWLASFICRPPWDGVMASGWHVHHSWVDRASGRNAFADAGGLSPLAGRVIAGELAHAAAMTSIAVPTLNGYERFRAAALSPERILWGRDNRGAMLRVLDAERGVAPGATRIEHRLPEPHANPWLVLAALASAGLDGVECALDLPPACESPYADGPQIAKDAADALADFRASEFIHRTFGATFVDAWSALVASAIRRHAEAVEWASDDAARRLASRDWQRREYLF